MENSNIPYDWCPVTGTQSGHITLSNNHQLLVDLVVLYRLAEQEDEKWSNR